jgi:hypothetical protein
VPVGVRVRDKDPRAQFLGWFSWIEHGVPQMLNT